MFFKRALYWDFVKKNYLSLNLLNILYFVTYLFWLTDWLKTVPALKGPKPALGFGKAGLEGLPPPGNPEAAPGDGWTGDSDL